MNSNLPNKLACLVAVASFPLALTAQVAVERAVFGAGGGASSGGVYTISDTTGESPLGVASSGPDVATAGFWGTFGSLPEPYFPNWTVVSNETVALPLAAILQGSDADGEPVSVTGVDAVSAMGGAVTLATNSILYTTPTNYIGPDSFQYTIADDVGGRATGLVSVTVSPGVITVTTNAPDGPGSLFEAISTINHAFGARGWRVVFAPSLAGQTISLTEAGNESFGPSALVISNAQVIDASAAPGLTLSIDSSASPMRLIYVAPGAHLTLDGLTLQGGEALGGNGGAGGGGGGGGAGFGGAIYNDGSVTLTQVTLSSNSAIGGMGGAGAVGPPGAGGVPNGNGGFGGGLVGSGTCGGTGGLGAGGAIFNHGGLLQMTNCLIQSNSVTEGAGGAGLNGCDGVSGGPAVGGGIFNYNGYAYITDCIFTNNDAAGLGNGLCNYGDAAASWVFLNGDNISDPGATNDFASLSDHGGDAQTVEGLNTISSQDALWFSPIPNVGTFKTNEALSVPIVLNMPTNVSGPFPVQAASSDASLVASSNLVFSGAGGQYTLAITPAPNGLGMTLITVSAEGSGLSAEASFTASFGLFLTVTITPGGRLLQIATDPGVRCTIQFATSLTHPNWATLGDMIEVAPGHYQLIDSATGDSVRYYRAVVP